MSPASPWERNVNSLHLAYFFAHFQITSTAAVGDLYRKPMRQAEEAVSGHSSPASISSQQVGAEHVCFMTGARGEKNPALAFLNLQKKK